MEKTKGKTTIQSNKQNESKQIISKEITSNLKQKAVVSSTITRKNRQRDESSTATKVPDINNMKPLGYLMWENNVVGKITAEGEVHFYLEIVEKLDDPQLNLFVPENMVWSKKRFTSFLEERTFSRKREDFRHIILANDFRGKSLLDVALITKSTSLRDKFWITKNPKESWNKIQTYIFGEVNSTIKRSSFLRRNQPAGANRKYYDKDSSLGYGILKSPSEKDDSIEMNLVVHKLANLLGIKTCTEKQVGTAIFSKFEFSHRKDILISAHQLMSFKENFNTDYHSVKTFLSSLNPDLEVNLIKTILLDFITYNRDRSFKDWSFIMKEGSNKLEMYPLFANGTSLFYKSKDTTIDKHIENRVGWFRAKNQMFDTVSALADILKTKDISKLINLNLTKDDILKCFENTSISDWKRDLAAHLIITSLAELKSLNQF